MIEYTKNFGSSYVCCSDNEAGYSKRMAELCNIVAAMNISKKEPSFKYEWTIRKSENLTCHS